MRCNGVIQSTEIGNLGRRTVQVVVLQLNPFRREITNIGPHAMQSNLIKQYVQLREIEGCTLAWAKEVKRRSRAIAGRVDAAFDVDLNELRAQLRHRRVKRALQAWTYPAWFVDKDGMPDEIVRGELSAQFRDLEIRY